MGTVKCTSLERQFDYRKQDELPTDQVSTPRG